MKNTFLILLFFAFFSTLTNAQTFPEPTYTNTNGWVFRNTALMPGGNIQVNAESPTLVPNPGITTGTPNGSIGIAQGALHFNNMNNGSNNYVSAEYNMMGALTDNWVVEFQFRPTGFGTNPGNTPATGAFIFSLTDGPGNRFRAGTDANQAAGKVGVAGQMISVVFANTVENHDYYIKPFAKWTDDNQPDEPNDIYWGAMLGNSGQIDLDGAATIGTLYRIRLERLNTVDYRLTVWREDEVEPIGERCFFLNHNLTNLSYIQHSNVTAASDHRYLTGSLDNLVIQDQTLLDDCCMPTQILGPSSICLGTEGGGADFTVSGGGMDLTYNWSLVAPFVPRGFLASSNHNNYNIRDFGQVTEETTFTISVDIFCGEGECARFLGTLTTEVTVRPLLDAGYGIQALNAGVDIPTDDAIYDIDITILSNPNGSLHMWELFEGQNCTDNPNLNASIPTTSTSNVDFMFSGVNEGTAYSVLHTITYADGSCPATYCTYASGGRRPLGEEGKGNLYPNPSTGTVNIEYKEAITENTQYIIKDALGKTVMQGNIRNQNTEIEIKENGIFLLEIWKGETIESVERVIIN